MPEGRGFRAAILMKALGPVLAVIGIFVGIFAVVNCRISKIISSTHMSLYIGIVGLVLLVIGAGLAMMGRRAAA
jgi:hypothetical protein